MLVVGSVVLRVTDLARQVRFWTEALGYEARTPADDDFVLLRPGDGRPGPNLSLDVAPSEWVLPPRIHLDLSADDQQAEVRRLVALGAQEVPWTNRPAGADYVIMQDPEGNRFCVVDGGDRPAPPRR